MPSHNHNLVLRSDKIQHTKDKQKYYKEEIALFGECPKFNLITKKHDKVLTPKQAIIFLKLRSEDCPRHDAVIYSQRNLCKWDSTQTRDGPATCRVLKPSPIHKAMISGWQNAGGDVPYEVEPEYESDLKKICLEDSRDKEIQEHFDRNEARIKNDFKAKIQILQKFYESMNEKYNFDLRKLGPKKMREQLKSFKQLHRDSREKPLQYMKFRGVKFLHVLDEAPHPDSTSQARNQTAIEEMRAFSKLINVKRKELKFKEKFADDLFYHLNPESKSSAPDGSSFDFSKGMFQKIADQSKAVIHLVDSKGVAESLGKSKGLDSIEGSAGLTAKNKDLFASDFNQSQYMFKVKEVVSTSKQIRLNKVKKIMERIDEISPTSPDGLLSNNKLHLGDKVNSLKSTEFNSRSSSMIKGKIKLIKNNRPRVQQTKQQSGELNSSHDSQQSTGRLDKDARFQNLLNNFIHRNIEKINQPYQPRSVTSNNLLDLVKIKSQSQIHEEKKLIKPSTPIKPHLSKGKLSLDLQKGRHIFFEKTSMTMRAETTQESKTSARRFFRRVKLEEQVQTQNSFNQ